MGLNSNSIFKHIEVLHAIYDPVDSFFTIHQSEIKHSIVVKTSTATAHHASLLTLTKIYKMKATREDVRVEAHVEHVLLFVVVVYFFVAVNSQWDARHVELRQIVPIKRQS